MFKVPEAKKIENKVFTKEEAAAYRRRVLSPKEEQQRVDRYNNMLKGNNLTKEDLSYETYAYSNALDWAHALSAAVKKKEAETAKIPALKVNINGMDKQPQSYGNALHEKIPGQ
jgi:hypothetical protein